MSGLVGLPDEPRFNQKPHRVRLGGRVGHVTIIRGEGITQAGPWIIRYCVIWEDDTDSWHDEWELEDADER